jgi:hypothetical protein
VSNCTFPEYGIPVAVAGSGSESGSSSGAGSGSGAAGAGGMAAAGGGGSAGSGGVAGGGNVAGYEAGAAGGGAAGEAGGGGEPCLFPAPITYPAHCFDRSAGEGESGTDCGLECAPCSSNQACTVPSDCLSKQCAPTSTCVPLISMSYTPIDVSAKTLKPKFRLNLTYLDAVSMSLRDLTIRYYYNHNDVTEPIIGSDSQATIDPGNAQVDISNRVLTSVHRFPLGPAQNGFRTDSYVEIAFNDSTTVITGTKFVITQEFAAGSTDQLFDQNSHYSFFKTNTPVANAAIVVYRAEERLWGVDPPLALFPECAFAYGLNMNGPQLTVDGELLAAEDEAELTFAGGAPYSSTAKVLPATSLTTTSMLSTGRTLNTGDSAVWSVPNGKYWAYAWLSSTVSSDNGTLTIGASAADKFFGTLTTTSTPAVARWGLLGPYSVDVTGNSLTLAVDGSVHVAGLKLYAAQR